MPLAAARSAVAAVSVLRPVNNFAVRRPANLNTLMPPNVASSMSASPWMTVRKSSGESPSLVRVPAGSRPMASPMVSVASGATAPAIVPANPKKSAPVRGFTAIPRTPGARGTLVPTLPPIMAPATKAPTLVSSKGSSTSVPRNRLTIFAPMPGISGSIASTSSSCNSSRTTPTCVTSSSILSSLTAIIRPPGAVRRVSPKRPYRRRLCLFLLIPRGCLRVRPCHAILIL